MLTIPIQAIPNQTLGVVLADQSVTLRIYQRSNGLYVDLYVNDALIIGGVLCENENMIVRTPYLGFIGDLAFCDTQGTDDPVFTGLGTRWALIYFSADELALAGVG